MEKDNPLLPFAYTNSSINDSIPYDTTPRDKSTIDENARVNITRGKLFYQHRHH